MKKVLGYLAFAVLSPFRCSSSDGYSVDKIPDPQPEITDFLSLFSISIMIIPIHFVKCRWTPGAEFLRIMSKTEITLFCCPLFVNILHKMWNKAFSRCLAVTTTRCTKWVRYFSSIKLLSLNILLLCLMFSLWSLLSDFKVPNSPGSMGFL